MKGMKEMQSKNKFESIDEYAKKIRGDDYRERSKWLGIIMVSFILYVILFIIPVHYFVNRFNEKCLPGKFEISHGTWIICSANEGEKLWKEKM